MSEDGQRESGSDGSAHRGRPGAKRARQDPGGQGPPGDGQDHVGTPRPDALIPALDEGQLAALRQIGREWDQVSAAPQVWRQALPVGAAIVVLMLAVGVSYRQTIRAYPQGGGSYIVASEELGRVPGLMAAAGLLIDYVMTVAVSIASGVAAITSAYPSMQPATVWIGVGVIVILLAGNLRGVRRVGSGG